jgi:hypothetical protein
MNSKELQLEGEEWRPVEEYPGYEVSNLGRFRSYWTTRGRSNTPRIKSIIKNRYMKVAVHTPEGKNTLVLFARLVAETFIGKPNGRLIVYLDGNSDNCRLDNLAYATRTELGSILTLRRFLKNGEDSSLGRKKAMQRKYYARLQRAKKVKELRDKGLTYRAIGEYLGISESGAYRIYAGSNNHMLVKALQVE